MVPPTSDRLSAEESAVERAADGEGGTPAARPAGDDLAAVLLVRVAETWLGLDARVVEEVIAVEVPAPLPFAPPHLLGVIVHNERVLPLVHTARLFGLSPDESKRDQSFERTIILKVGGMSAGLLCDRAAGVVEVEPGALEPVTLLTGQDLTRFLRAELDTPRGRAGVVDVEALFEAARVHE